MSAERELCAICLDEMSVPSFKQTETTCVEGDCTRLACGHAMHTCCLVESLIRTEGKCIQCNRRNIDPYQDEFTWEQRLEFERVCFNKLKGIKKLPDVKKYIDEYSTIMKELRAKHSDFKKQVDHFKINLRKEMEIDRLVKDVKRAKKQALNGFRKEVQKTKGVETIALSHLTTLTLNKWLLKETYNTQRLYMTRGFFSNSFY